MGCSVYAFIIVRLDRRDLSDRECGCTSDSCLLREPVGFATLASVFQFTRDQLIDAISESSEIFLVASEDESGETLYQLSPL